MHAALRLSLAARASKPSLPAASLLALAMSSAGAAPALRPSLQRAAKALSDATTPEAAYAAVRALDVACLQAFEECRDVAQSLVHASRADEQGALTAALVAGVSAATLAALLRSAATPRHAVFASRLLYCGGLTHPASRLRAKTLLKSGDVLDALLGAVAAADRLMTAGGEVSNTVSWLDGDAWMVRECPPLPGAALLDAHLCALCTCLEAWQPRLAARLAAAAAQRDALFAVLLARYTPFARRATERGPLPMLHGAVIMMLQTLTVLPPTLEALSDPGQAFSPRMVRALVACLLRQAGLARARPLGDAYMAREMSDACSVLVNCVHPHDGISADSCARRAALLCAEGAPAALLAALHERSALLCAPQLDADATALFLVTQLVREMMRYPAARTQLLRAHEPSAGTPLLTVLVAIALFYMPPAGSVSPARVGYGALRLAQGLAAEPAAGESDDDAALLACVSQHQRASLLLAQRCGWDVTARVREMVAFRSGGGVHDDGGDAHRRSGGVPAASAEAFSPTGTLSPLQHSRVGGLSMCGACLREKRLDEAPFQKCGRCRAVLYCSKACQVAHWRAHKRECTR
jgi:hypothetical protein